MAAASGSAFAFLRRAMRLATPLVLLLASACDSTAAGPMGGGAEVIDGDEDKGDAVTDGVEVTDWLTTQQPAASAFSSATTRRGFIFFATEGSEVGVEVTQSGTASGLDTVLRIHGPRSFKGTYDATLAEDDDGGFGKLSRVQGVGIPADGFYLAEVAIAAPPTTSKTVRVALTCPAGACDRPGPIGYGNDIRWAQRSAEYQALAHQAYQVATRRLDDLVDGGLAGDFAVVLDADETVLSNAQYQAERAALGVGFSSASWSAWVARRQASAMPGAAAFLDRVHAAGGTAIIVTNRKAAGECQPTEDNLRAVGLEHDAILCKTDTSDKNPRFRAIEAGTAVPELPAMPVVLYVGDNILDFPELSQDIRHQGDGAFAAFGDSFIAIPNPMYGSWEKNE